MKISKIIKLMPCFWLPLLVFLVHVLILIPSGIYTTYDWLDIPMHLIGGASIAYSYLCILNKCREEIIIKDKLVSIIVIVSFVGLIAVFWEFGEFFVYDLFRLQDTLFDIFMGLSGGFLVALFGKWPLDIV